jgi:hypothetical protein
MRRHMAGKAAHLALALLAVFLQCQHAACGAPARQLRGSVGAHRRLQSAFQLGINAQEDAPQAWHEESHIEGTARVRTAHASWGRYSAHPTCRSVGDGLTY